MAQFCTKCGTPVGEGMSFCMGCGAPIGGPVPPAATPMPSAPSPPAAAMAAPAVGVPVAAPSKGSPLLKIVLIVVAVLMFIGLLSAGACVYYAYRVRQRIRTYERQTRLTFPTSTGREPSQAQPGTSAEGGQPQSSAIDTGVPPYPGATVAAGQGSLSLGLGGIKVQEYTTTDSVDKVVAFYKDKLGPNAMVAQSGDQASVHAVGANAVIHVAITVDASSGKTKIAITRIGK